MRRRASVIILKDGKVLLFHRFNKGLEYYSVPGGGIEKGESPKVGAIREAKEETNLDIVLGKELEVQIIDVDKAHPEMGRFANYNFIVTEFSGRLNMGDEEIRKTSIDNTCELKSIPLDDLEKLPVSKDIRDTILRAVQDMSPNNIY
jgi:ADP-ribose pyrophosphatase YjhB (NUDIX family)